MASFKIYPLSLNMYSIFPSNIQTPWEEPHKVRLLKYLAGGANSELGQTCRSKQTPIENGWPLYQYGFHLGTDRGNNKTKSSQPGFYCPRGLILSRRSKFLWLLWKKKSIFKNQNWSSKTWNIHRKI